MTSQPDTIWSLFSLLVEPAPHLMSPWLDHLCLPHYMSPTTLLDMHHLTCGISSLLHSVNLILFTLLLVHLILCISPHHSHHLRSHYLSLPWPFTPDLKLICFTNPFLHSCSDSFWTAFTDLFYIFLAMCARLSWSHSVFESTLNSLSYRITYRCIADKHAVVNDNTQ